MKKDVEKKQKNEIVVIEKGVGDNNIITGICCQGTFIIIR